MFSRLCGGLDSSRGASLLCRSCSRCSSGDGCLYSCSSCGRIGAGLHLSQGSCCCLCLRHCAFMVLHGCSSLLGCCSMLNSRLSSCCSCLRASLRCCSLCILSCSDSDVSCSFSSRSSRGCLGLYRRGLSSCQLGSSLFLARRLAGHLLLCGRHLSCNLLSSLDGLSLAALCCRLLCHCRRSCGPLGSRSSLL